MQVDISRHIQGGKMSLNPIFWLTALFSITMNYVHYFIENPCGTLMIPTECRWSVPQNAGPLIQNILKTMSYMGKMTWWPLVLTNMSIHMIVNFSCRAPWKISLGLSFLFSKLVHFTAIWPTKCRYTAPQNAECRWDIIRVCYLLCVQRVSKLGIFVFTTNLCFIVYLLLQT